MKQLIYRYECLAPFELEDSDGIDFIKYRNGIDAIKYMALLIWHRGIAGYVKDVVKLFTAGRYYFCIVDDNRIVSEVYVVIGKCRFYEVDESAAVLGPVWTDGNMRGKGLATSLLKRTINSLLALGYNTFYIDTSENNPAMQNVIEKCGFGNSAGDYEK